jgi:nitrogen-specific signal transduction histidine kinase
MESVPLETRRRARFQALRRTIFAEMSQSSARLRLALVLPFYAGVLVILACRGFPAIRIAVQSGMLLFYVFLFVHQTMRTAPASNKLRTFVASFLAYAICLANTGGLASPLIPLGLGMLTSAAVTLEAPRQRTTFLGVVVVVAMALGMLSHSALGALPPPLAPRDGWPSPEYTVIAMGSLVFVALVVSNFGTLVTTAYERVAMELANRREEICSETEDRTRALEGIAARLAHEVKNPLAAIKGLSTHMARNATDEKTAERLSIVAAEADRLQAIVDGFLSFSRGLDELQVAETKPYDLARELTLLLETRATDAGVQLEVQGSRDVELNADPRKLRQALLNVVLNAMQASPAGEKVIIDVGAFCPMTGRTRIRVIDHGTGMAPDVLERIKKPYFTTREGGSGLGVAVARGLIEQHGGQLEYESRPGAGTTVTIDLPRCALSAPGAQKHLPNPLRRCAGFAVATHIQEESEPTESAEEPVVAR